MRDPAHLAIRARSLHLHHAISLVLLTVSSSPHSSSSQRDRARCSRRARPCTPQLRRLMLYPVELGADADAELNSLYRLIYRRTQPARLISIWPFREGPWRIHVERGYPSEVDSNQRGPGFLSRVPAFR